MAVGAGELVGWWGVGGGVGVDRDEVGGGREEGLAVVVVGVEGVVEG